MPAMARKLLALSLAVLVGAVFGACSAASDRAPDSVGTGPSASASGGPGPGGGGGAAASSSAVGVGGLGLDGGGDSGWTGGDPVTCDQAAVAKSYVGCDFWPTVV